MEAEKYEEAVRDCEKVCKMDRSRGEEAKTMVLSCDRSIGGTSASQRQKFHTDEAVQCLHNKSGSHGVPTVHLLNFMFLLVEYGKVLCSTANELQHASSREEYIPRILTVLL